MRLELRPQPPRGHRWAPFGKAAVLTTAPPSSVLRHSLVVNTRVQSVLMLAYKYLWKLFKI